MIKKISLRITLLLSAFLASDGLVFAQTSSCSNTSGTGFVSLSCIPALDAAANSSGGLASFFNAAYLICIGLVTVIAVLQIMRAGIMYVFSGAGVAEISEARRLIGASLFGLLIVLTPALVLGVINKNITANLSFDVSNLNVAPPPQSNQQSNTNSSTGVTTSVTGTNLQTAIFSSNDPDKNNAAMQNWVATNSSCPGFRKASQSSTCSQDNLQGGNTTCTSATPAKAICEQTSSQTYTFVNQGSSLSLGFPDLVPATPSDGTGMSSYRSTCSADGGSICAFSPASVDCPANLNATVAHGASGKCYTAKILCTSGNVANIGDNAECGGYLPQS